MSKYNIFRYANSSSCDVSDTGGFIFINRFTDGGSFHISFNNHELMRLHDVITHIMRCRGLLYEDKTSFSKKKA